MHNDFQRRAVCDLQDSDAALERLIEASGERPLALFLDYDGTLTAIVERPELARLSSSMRQTLEGLAARTSVAVVSGRDREDVEQLVNIGNLVFAGSHGFDIRRGHGQLLRFEHELGRACLPDLDDAEAELGAVLSGMHGVQIERKRFAIAVHYRRAHEHDIGRVESVVRRTLAERPNLRMRLGKRVFELTPAVDWHKGRAVRWLIDKLDLRDALPIYIGDDLTDEDAFVALGDEGVGILVGDHGEATAARYHLEDVEAVETLLRRLTEALPERERACEDAAQRLVVVSNRLPVVLRRDDDGSWRARPGSGGLVSALGPVLSGRGGMWIGWAGTSDPSPLAALRETSSEDVGYTLEPLTLSDEEVDLYYHGFANEVLWPLFHDMVDRCNFDPRYWPAYRGVNRRFAERIAATTSEGDYIWVQDYHLMLVAQELTAINAPRKCGFFLHIPFPPLDIFLKLPWRFEILAAMLEFELIGFQTVRDRRNFIQCLRALMPSTKIKGGRKQVQTVTHGGRQLRVGAFPIGIDYRSFAGDAASEEVAQGAWYIHEKLPRRQLILGVDRLDYSKGIPHRLRAFGAALERHPRLRGNVTFVQVVVPSRVDVPAYQRLKAEIEQLVGEINGRFTISGWTPIHYIFRSLDRTELLSYYRTAEIALVTPLKDGMNLVAKEYCACSLEENGVLILSEFAGAAAQLHNAALLVNPYDIESVADAIYRAYTMDAAERRALMQRARRNVLRNSVFWWVNSFLRAAFSLELDDFTPVELYVPQPRPDDHRGADEGANERADEGAGQDDEQGEGEDEGADEGGHSEAGNDQPATPSAAQGAAEAFSAH